MSKVLRELRKGELTIKDMSILREGDSARVQHKKDSASLKDYSLLYAIRMAWGVAYQEEKRDFRPFHLHIDNRRYLLSWAELKEMDAAGFFRREEGNPSSYQLRYFDGPRIVVDVELNEDAERDMMFRLTIEGDKTVICDWYEWLRAGRFI